MEQRFKAGDFLFYQLEAGFALLRLLEVDGAGGDAIWHLSAFHDLFPDVESIEMAIMDPGALSVSIPHVAMTNRAFESTQVAEIGSSSLTQEEIDRLEAWRNDPESKVADVSVRLLTGLR